MQGKSSQRELRKQLSEKCGSTVHSIVKIAGSVREQSGSEVRVSGSMGLCSAYSAVLYAERQMSPENTSAGCSRGSEKICSKGEIYNTLTAGDVLLSIQDSQIASDHECGLGHTT